VTQRDHEKAWRYVGRFMWSFANIEGYVDGIFQTMFNLNAVSYLLLQSNLDFRKKLALIQLVFKHQQIDHGKTLSKVHELHNIRNAIAHSSFEPVGSFKGIDGVRYKAGIEFSYVERSGEVQVPNPVRDLKQKGVQKRPHKKIQKVQEVEARSKTEDVQLSTMTNEEWRDWYNVQMLKSTITYEEFDEYDAQAKKLVDMLDEIGARCEPINEGLNFMRDIAKIIAASDNVVLFTKPAPGVQ